MLQEQFMLPKTDSAEFLGNSPLKAAGSNVVIYLDHVKQIARHAVIGPEDSVKKAVCDIEDDYPDTVMWLYKKDFSTKGVIAAARLIAGV